MLQVITRMNKFSFRISLAMIVLSYTILSCSGNKKTGPALDVRIIGLDKGTVYLKAFENDTLLKIIDSAKVKGQKQIRFDLHGVPPQLLLLEVKERPGEYLMFFSDDTLVQITTELDRFGYAKRITGGTNVRLWRQYKDMLMQYNSRKLDLVKAMLTARQKRDTIALDSVQRKLQSIERRRKLFSYNFALSKPFAPVRAYVAYTEFRDNPAALDSIYHSWKTHTGIYDTLIRHLLDSINRP